MDRSVEFYSSKFEFTDVVNRNLYVQIDTCKVHNC